ncbi:MAG: hypothetical protein ACXIUQ_00440 [Cecembia sp.]
MKKTRSKFYLYMSFLILGLAFVGFGPSFIFRPFVEPPVFSPAITPMIIVHAIIGFLWLGVFVTQTTLVQANQIEWHKKLGWAGLVLAVLLCITIATSALNRAESGLALSPEVLVDSGSFGPATILVFDLGGIFNFATMFILGMAYRRNPIKHKTFMLYAGIMAVMQTFPRIGIIFFGADYFFQAAVVMALTVLLIPLIYETIKYGKPKWLTIGIFLFLIVALNVGQILGQSPSVIEVAEKIVEWWSLNTSI